MHIPMSMQRFNKAGMAGGRGAGALDRKPAMILSEAAKAALTTFLAQASLPPSERGNARCRQKPINLNC